MDTTSRTLIAIGGHEDKDCDRAVLRRFVRNLRSPKIVVATLASDVAKEMWQDYQKAFTELGVREVVHLELDRRFVDNEEDSEACETIRGAGGVFFTGGDQLRITTKLGGSRLCETIQELYSEGVVIGGTSAGASVLTENMLVSGEGETHRIGDSLTMAPGLGFIHGVVIDQHFGERGRIGRLLGVVAQNPRVIGFGIDEETAVIIRNENDAEVIGSGAVYVVDCRRMTQTNLSEAEQDKTMSVFGATLHVLSEGDCFNISERRPHKS